MHYVYRITNTKIRKYYYGVRTSKNNSPKDDIGFYYFSSSKDEEFMQDQKDNPQNYKYKVVRIFKTREAAEVFESEIHNKFDVQFNENFYNKSNNTLTGFSFFGHKHTDESKNKISKTSAGKLTVFDKIISKNVYVTSEEFKNNSNLVSMFEGELKSDTQKQKMSEARKGKIVAKDLNTGENIYITIDEFYSDEKYVACNKGQVTVKDLTTGENYNVTKEEFEQNDNLVGNNHGKVTVRDKTSGKTFNVTKEEFEQNDNLDSVNKGKIRTDEYKKRVSKIHKSRKKETCKYCNKTLDISNYTRWHGDNCKLKPN